MSHSSYRSSKLKKKKRNRLYLKMSGLLILFSLLIYGLSWLTFADFFQIKEVSVNETQFVSNEEIKNIVWQEADKKTWLIFSNKNILFLHRDEIIRRVKENFKSVSDVQIDFQGLQNISLNISEYNEVANWCGGKCYLINEKGYIFQESPLLRDTSLPQFFGVIDENADPVGQTYINQETFEKVMQLISLVKQINLNIHSVSTDQSETLYLKTETGLVLLYKRGDDPQTIASNLNAVIEKDAINQAQLQNIEYIDLRFGNKVYYKIK